MVSIGDIAHCRVLVADELGTSTKPISTIHRASTDIYQNDLNWVDADTMHVRLRLKEDGHLQVVEDIEFFEGPSITSNLKRFSVGLNAAKTAFVVRDEVNGIDVLTVNESGPVDIPISSITALQSTLDSKQAALTVNGQPVSTAVLNTFSIASGGDGNPANSLLTAKAIEDWFEQLQNSLLMISPGQSGPGFRVASISTVSPSAVNVPSCLAVSNLVSTRLADYSTTTQMNAVIAAHTGASTLHFEVEDITFYANGVADIVLSGISYPVGNFVFPAMAVKAPGSGNYYRPLFAADVFMTDTSTWLNQTLANLQIDKVNQSQVTSSINPSVSAAGTSIITEAAYVNNLTVGGFHYLTINTDPVKFPQHALFGASVTEVTDPSFHFIEARVHDVLHGFNATMDSRLATMACTHNHITSQINQSKVSPTFTGTVSLPNPINILIATGLGTDTLPLSDYLTNYIDGHRFSDGVDMTNIYLENSSYLHYPNNVTGLGVLNSAENAYVPVFCEDVFIGGDSVIPGKSIAELIDEKVGVPYTGFFIPSGVTDVNLGYLSNVSSDIQQQIDDVSANVTNKIFNPIILGQNAATHTLLYGSSNFPNVAIQSSITLNGLNVANAAGDDFNPIFCSELYTGGSSASVGTSLTAQLAGKVNTTDTTTSVTADESKLVTSGAVHTALAGKLNSREVVSTVTQSSQALITSGGVFTQFTTLTNLITALTARVVILEASITPTTTPGLSGIKYFGYYNDSFTFFNTASQYSGFPQNYTSIELGDEGSNYSYRFTGNFTPNATGIITERVSIGVRWGGFSCGVRPNCTGSRQIYEFIPVDSNQRFYSVNNTSGRSWPTCIKTENGRIAYCMNCTGSFYVLC
jgi:hypothetical protein